MKTQVSSYSDLFSLPDMLCSVEMDVSMSLGPLLFD